MVRKPAQGDDVPTRVAVVTAVANPERRAQNGRMGKTTRRQGSRAIGWAAWALLVALTAATAEAQGEGTGKTYGAGVKATRAVAVKALLDEPTSYVGKVVRVDGVVSAVCQSMGCWLEISDPDIGRGVRFKVKDGVIVFPRDAQGRRASAEGVFEEIATSPVREAHQAGDRAREATGTPAVTPPAEKIYWVRASGAVLY